MKILASKIREDLKNIRYYFSSKKVLDSVSISIGENEVVKKIEIYDKAIKSAEPKMFDLYITLYVKIIHEIPYQTNGVIQFNIVQD